LEAYIEKSPVLVTLLVPYIGYMKAAELYKEALRTNRSIRELVVKKGLMSKQKVDKILSKKNVLTM
ncbi:MAG: aspartate ammonia-lyase, partial [Nitrososphaera sp.]